MRSSRPAPRAPCARPTAEGPGAVAPSPLPSPSPSQPIAAAMAGLVVALVVALAGLVCPVQAEAASPPDAHRSAGLPPPPVYRPPTDAPVVDPYRPPAHPYGPGNRGIDYGTAPGDPLRAVADGVVSFAGQVGGALFVTLRHADDRFPDGLRSTLARVASIAVRAGDRVVRGQVLAWASGPTHLGIRHGRRYLDPAVLFTPLRPIARLIPVPAAIRARAAPR